jgi:hypothetical protein
MPSPPDEFWHRAGTALIIFAILFGLGACSYGCGMGTYYANSTKERR